ncbi:uncharacterized protein G2W53_043464 [Senna tora]|uniref:Uncharacterized protein n=1 Tax=Senna tora TaxID=362788 RepID=A0A834SHS7_9FABA|nr:uncharacterized protein G2W53_043464 [Senna tora]
MGMKNLRKPKIATCSLMLTVAPPFLFPVLDLEHRIRADLLRKARVLL